MGRTMTKPRSSLSGAVIFYGASGVASAAARSQQKAQSLDVSLQGHLNLGNHIADLSPASPPLYASPSSASTTGSSSITSSLNLKSDSSPGTSLSSLSVRSKEEEPSVMIKSHSKSSRSLTSNDFSAILGVVKDTTSLFVNVPYIQVVATMIQRIIQIADDVRTNKDRSLELIDKVVLYAGVIFDALNSSELRTSDDLDGLKSDLLHITSVLEAIYKILESFSVSTLAARINRVVLREEILARLEEHDRRLDTVITSFQLKSSIVLRSKASGTQAIKKDLYQLETQAPQSTAQPSRPIVRLRSKPQIMFGRDAEIEKLVGVILQQPPARVAILGPGGIGKTSLALSVLHDEGVAAHFKQNRLFISCEAATAVDHIVGDLALSLQITGDLCSGKLFDAVLDRLSQSPFLVVLDNFETPWEMSIAQADVESLLQELANLDTVSLLVTIRGSQHPPGVSWSQLLPPLKPVDLGSAVEIFSAIAHKKDEYTVKLIQAVDCVPLAVTLLGNLAAVDGETSEALWRRWCDENIAMVESGDGRLNSLDCSIQISLSSPRIRRDPDALNLLSVIALLPDGVTSETAFFLEGGIPGILHTKKGISTLRQNALISVDSYGSTRILSPIRLHMHARHPPSSEARRFLQDYFLDLARHGIVHNDFVMRKRLCAESGNIEAMLVDSLEVLLGRPLEDVVEAALAFCHYTYLVGMGSSRAISLATEKLACIPTTPSNPVPPIKRIVRPHRFLGLRFWKDTPKALPLPDTKDSEVDDHCNAILKLRGDCFGCWGQLLSRQWRFDEAEKKLQLAVQLHVQAGDTSGHAYDLHNLGCLLSRSSSTFSQAELSFQEALALHEQLGDKIGAAYDLMGSGQILLQKMSYIDAKKAFDKALQLFAECGDELGQASALNNLGHAVLCYSTPRDADHHFLRALEINAKTGDVLGQADTLAGLACTLLLRSRFSDAQQRIEEAIALRSPIENPDHLHILGRVFVAEYKFEQAVEMLRRAETLHVEIGDQHGIAEDKRYLLQIDFFQGRLFGAPDVTRMWELEDRLSGIEPLHNEDELGLADAHSTIGMIRLLTPDWESPREKWYLKNALRIHTKIGNLLGQAFDHYQLGCFYLRSRSFDKAGASFMNALKLHEQTENVQGEADDYNKLAELSLRRGLFQEALTGITCYALKLHTQIGDIAGQADDVYIQACVFLGQSRLEEAEDTIRRALDLHLKAGVVHGQALDLATLSSVLWQRCGDDEEARVEALQTLERAAQLFARCVANRELRQCRQRYEAILKEDSRLQGVLTPVLAKDDADQGSSWE
ncbi:hypothetical protein FPV67DRAFT_1652208 [Lyophyllum atratum]|nr:hypothetical protein FPV67DRAFT_1652208 [Lyophyllum atratum]